MESDALRYFVDHLFLLPILPQKNDYNESYETQLLRCVADTLQSFKPLVDTEIRITVQSMSKTIDSLIYIRSNGGLSQDKLMNALQRIPQDGGYIPLHFQAQNAGMLVSKSDDYVCFEAFELSPLNEAVMSIKGRLQRDFPGSALAVKQNSIEVDGFLATLSETCAKLSHQLAPGMLPKVQKAGQLHAEDRDTTDPGMVTEFLMGFLSTIGGSVKPSQIQKNTKEEVLWSNARSPWRRSSLWLLVRVTLQLGFSRSMTAKGCQEDLYKCFMAFLHAQVLEKAIIYDFDSDTLTAMQAKVSRRLIKLQYRTQVPFVQVIHQTLLNVQDILDKRWMKIQTDNNHQLIAPSLDSKVFQADTMLHIPKLDGFIEYLDALHDDKTACNFQPKHAISQFLPSTLPDRLESPHPDYDSFILVAFHEWVQLYLPQYLQQNLNLPQTCRQLQACMENYASFFHSMSSQTPERYSIFILTMVEIWIACDKSACEVNGLLEDFDVDFPVELLNSLLLPQKSQLTRLLNIEQYIRSRRGRALVSSPCIYTAFGHAKSFAVRYFDMSPEHQALRSKIEAKATQDRLNKCQELTVKKQEYQDLMERYDSSTCQYVTRFNHRTEESYEEHSTGCQKCTYKRQARAIKIEIHEWPLPSQEPHLKATVFELDVPDAFGAWRDATQFLMHDVLRSTYNATTYPQASCPLHQFKGLRSYFQSHGNSRIGILSEIKPHTNTHRLKKPINTVTESEVCLSNGPVYRYFDSAKGVFVQSLKVTTHLLQTCTYELPAQLSSMQQFITRPPGKAYGKVPNDVISTQSNCPSGLTLDEYKGVCSIPLGYRIQWMNILTQLSMPSIDFKLLDTNLVIMQTIYQAGPQSDGVAEREGHLILTDEKFGLVLLEKLEVAAERVKGNWEASRAVSIFTQLTTRLLSMTSSTAVRAGSLKYLAMLRLITLNWVNSIRQDVQKTADETQRINMFAKIVEIALTCISTFDVDPTELLALLDTPTSASVFIQSSIAVQEHHSTSSSNHLLHNILMERWKKVSFHAWEIFSNQTPVTRSHIFNHAIRNVWTAYVPGNSWSLLASPNNHWITCKTLSGTNDKGLPVHYNLLTAELLVNGQPLARLPTDYTNHSMHKILFGELILDVMPSTIPGMQFSAKRTYAGYDVHLGIKRSQSGQQTRTDMLVRAVQPKMTTLDVIPPMLFESVLPTAFIKDYVHWYDHKSSTIEFRPVQTPWSTAPANWKLHRVESTAYWSLTLLSEAVVGITGSTAQSYESFLNPLEDLKHIHLIYDQKSRLLNIKLPRLQLEFFVKPSSCKIYSKQYQGMYIDQDQDVGTLIGLQNKVILKHDNRMSNRLIVVPEGQVSYNKTTHHMIVTIAKGTSARVHAYHVDKRLGRLIDNGSLQSKLFLCYLHILTSFCQPDPLTLNTGAEQAISTLQSGAVKSFDLLSQENINTLHSIAKICPSRSYYPQNAQVMQQVLWDPNLSILSQNGMFHVLVSALFQQAREVAILFPGTQLQFPRLDFINPILLERELLRSATFRVSGFGAEKFSTEFDSPYSSRDRGQSSDRATRVTQICQTILDQRKSLYKQIDSLFVVRLWNRLAECGTIKGPNIWNGPEVNYDSKWLETPSTYLHVHWCYLIQQMKQTIGRLNSFQVMMWLGTLAFSKNDNADEIQALAALYNNPEIACIEIPSASEFVIPDGHDFKRSNITAFMGNAARSFQQCPERHLPRLATESEATCKTRRQIVFQNKRQQAISRCTDRLHNQWPCEIPQTPDDDTCMTYINLGNAMNSVRYSFGTWYRNWQLHQYFTRLGQRLEQLQTSQLRLLPCTLSPIECTSHARKRYISTNDVFLTVPSSMAGESFKLDLPTTETRLTSNNTDGQKLSDLVLRLQGMACQTFESTYVSELQESIGSLQHGATSLAIDYAEDEILKKLQTYQAQCSNHLAGLFRSMVNCSSNASETSAIAYETRQYPRISPIFFLKQLNRARWNKMSEEWKTIVVEYGLAFAEYQRAERLVQTYENNGDILVEMGNRRTWSPYDFPESLLLEVESGIMIRPVQESIAQHMRCPPSGQNTVTQLNMGEGKSSVIVPIVAAALANGTRLVRVIVGKPQSKQMLDMLIVKLGGMLNRRIYLMPFSRTLRLDASQADCIGKLYKDCMENRGVLLVQPEQILSFKLMGLEYVITDQDAAGKSLLRTFRFFEKNARDIVDESDENFNANFELIYTMGAQRHIELCPDRWTIIQLILDLIPRYAGEVKDEYPDWIAIEDRKTRYGFPKTRFLNEKAAKEVVARVAQHVCKNGLSVPGFPLARQPPKVKDAIYRYIMMPSLDDETIARVESSSYGSFWSESTRGALLLIRGLIAGGVLSFAFSAKRWRVNYGLDANRLPPTKMAVPFRARDSPTMRSEFSHPDVVIVLTNLSYYYGGLPNKEIFDALRHLIKSDQAHIEYGEWMRTAPTLPSQFRQLVGVNLSNRIQCESEIFPHLQYSKGAIDYYLSHIVFPKEMKEFPKKISASGWDIAATTAYPLTGFSGTNDSRHTLPLSVTHLDLPEQRHTNALVLKYLLQDENAVELLKKPNDDIYRSDAELLLEMVYNMSPEVRVILDVGAFILDLTNLDISKQWLTKKNDKDTKAVVFINDNDEISVVDRAGKVELLQTSPFATQLENCLVFLDEAHTRGIDLKLPKSYRAAVTLGPGLTKDRLAQACMRMRKLGKGQSVVFCVPEEIQVKIREHLPKDQPYIKVLDVLNWVIQGTWTELRHNSPLWVTQGIRFEEQNMLWENARRENDFSFTKSEAEQFLEDEAQSLEDRYRPRLQSQQAPSFSDFNGVNENLSRIVERCRKFNTIDIGSKSLQEEQERELSPETQRERQVEKPASLSPHRHQLHPHVLEFARTGRLVPDSKAFFNAFKSLASTSAATNLKVDQFPPGILATADFAYTVQPTGSDYISDSYQRSVQWILTSSNDDKIEHLIIISPFEANELLLIINQYKAVTLHLYAPRPNLEFRSLDSLDMFTQGAPFNATQIDPELIVQLNLFAGQLYIKSFNEYVAVCKFLGLASKGTDDGVDVAADGFVKPVPGSKGFKTSPVTFFHVLLSKIRRNCETIEKTHLGRILNGEVLEDIFGNVED